MKSIRNAVSKMQGQIENLKNRREEIKLSGRSEDWQNRAIEEAVDQAKDNLSELQGEALSAWLNEYAAAKKTEPKTNYVERNFYNNKFNNMLQQVEPEKIPELFEQVANNPEMSPYKQDFIDLAELKINDENRPAFEEAKQKRMTPAEEEQQRELAKLANIKQHLTMINDLAKDLLIDDVLNGYEPSMHLEQVFDEVAENADKIAGRSIGEGPEDTPEGRKILEDSRQEAQ